VRKRAGVNSSSRLHQANGIQVRRPGYGYDLYGNVVRQTLNGGLTQETYRYDELHRLIEATRTGAASGSTQYAYDAAGNFRYKSDFSTTASDAYGYTGGSCGGGPNAVKSVTTSAGTRTYCYDANGNLTADSVGLGLSYDHQNLTVVARRGALRDDFRYGPDGQRTRSWGSDGARVYLPGYEHRTDTGTTKVYIGDYAVVTNGGAGRKVEYLLKDRLGSVDAVADASGTLTETRGYDAFGKPRSGTWADLSPAKLQNVGTTPKGFTQHEHLNQLELIHMNGRVYDYHLGRFTGVDPFIQFPLNSQSLNPYSYILNNPLSGTDPTGYCIAETGSHIKNCETLTVTGYDAKGSVVESRSTRVNKGTLSALTFAINNGAIKTAESVPNIDASKVGSPATRSDTDSHAQSARHSGTTEEEYLKVGPYRYWKDVPISSDGYSSNAEVAAAGERINTTPARVTGDVESTPEQRAFMQRIAKVTFNAQQRLRPLTEFFIQGGIR